MHTVPVTSIALSRHPLRCVRCLSVVPKPTIPAWLLQPSPAPIIPPCQLLSLPVRLWFRTQDPAFPQAPQAQASLQEQTVQGAKRRLQVLRHLAVQRLKTRVHPRVVQAQAQPEVLPLLEMQHGWLEVLLWHWPPWHNWSHTLEFPECTTGL